ncbi:hypothetical protein G1H11_17960 [Phytoactinopolyspora alkaliphila]|uniref:DUF5709 domain-containing protein n=1 Tax=Phytoactinopolyspora alkaliphila TaxID=1783498 RepID=A0A6N9YQR8_9ACTN|nr:hypothetical protein [Phytoactinopolyspora alkaliphila]NED97188.1 hypothetical protein [Phytoactinopolyspora alkaliphila]
MADDRVPPDTFAVPEADAEEQRQPVTGDAAVTEERSRLDPEEPDLTPAEMPEEVPADADPADAYEQARSVDYDEDEYR